jgi:hypothetical protein
MVTLAFLKLLQDEGFGIIDVDMFYQKLTLDKKGIYIADIGESIERHSRDSQGYELFARGVNDIDGLKKLQAIRSFLVNEYQNICELPAVPPINNQGYTGVHLSKPSTITNVGLDAQNRIIYSMTGSIKYKEQ